jgi:hypothetical protein
VYVPPDAPQAVVFAGDGQLISQWGGSLEPADVPPTTIVVPDEDVRGRVRSRFGVALPAVRTAACGVSASGELALTMTERPGDHGDPFWQAEFPLMVAWAFGH